MIFLLALIGLACGIASLPVDGLAGAALGITAMTISVMVLRKLARQENES
jgi:hypothetical protein